MKELSQVWGELSDISQANILEMIGGKRNSNVVMSLLENFNVAEDVIKTTAESAGSALAENEKYLNSIRGSIAEFKATFQELAQTLIGSDFVKQVVDIGTWLLNILNSVAEVVDALGGLKTVLIATIGIIASRRITSFDKLANSIWKSIEPARNLLAAIELLPASFRTASKEGKGLAGAMDLLGVSASTAQIAIAGVFIVIATVIAVINRHKRSLDEQRSAAIEASKSLHDTSDSIEEYKNKANELRKEIDSGNLSEESAKNKREELIDVQKSLIETFGDEARGIDLVNGEIDEQIKKLDELTSDKWKEFERENIAAINRTKDLFSNYKLDPINFGFSDVSPTFISDLEKELNNSGIAIDLSFNSATGGIKEDISNINVDNIYEALDVYEQIYDITEQVGKETYGTDYANRLKNILESISGKIASIKNELSDNEELFNAYAENTLTYGEDYAKVWSDILSAQQKYDEAIKSGDSDAITEAIESMSKAKDAFFDKGFDDEAVNIYVERFFDSFDDAVENYQFGDTLSIAEKLKEQFDLGEIDYSEFKEKIEEVISESGFDEDGVKKLRVSIGVDDIETWRNTLKNEVGATEEFLDNLSISDLEIAYNIIKSSDSELSIDDLLRKIEAVKYSSGTPVDPFDFSNMISGLNEARDGLDGIISAMDQLREGTVLTKEQLANLALQYPKLLEASDLFTDGSIEGQQAMLNNFLEVSEAEYDAQIDTKIAEIDAQIAACEAQKQIEEDKMNLLLQLEADYANAKISTQAQLNEYLDEWNDYEGTQYVETKNGEIQATEEYLNSVGNSTANTTKDIEDIWDQSLAEFTGDYARAGSDVVKSSGDTVTKAGKKIGVLARLWNYLWTNIRGNKFIGDLSEIQAQINNAGQSVSDAVTSSYSSDGGSGAVWNDVTLDNVTEWTSAQKDRVTQRIDALNVQVDKLKTVRSNLESLKGLDLTSIYGKSGTSSGASKTAEEKQKEIEEYIANIDAYYVAEKRLESAISKAESISKRMKATDDPSERIRLSADLIQAYKDEAEAEKDLVDLKRNTIEKNAEALRALGFSVEYNAQANEFEIKNLEHLNKLVATSKGEYDTLQEATNALRKETESLIDVTESLNDDNIKAISTMEDLGYEILDVKKNIVDSIEDIYKKQIDAYQEVIDKRKEMIESAKDEYDYEEEIADKVKEIADLQTRIDQLALDDSRSAQAERASLMAELSEKQKDLSDTQRDHSVDSQLDALDRLGENYEKSKNDEIEYLRQTVDSTTEIWDAFYQTIAGNTVSISDYINRDIVSAWINAAKAVREYSDTVGSLPHGSGTVVSTAPKYQDVGVVSESNIGKVVLDDARQNSLYKIIDFQEELSKRLGVQIGSLSVPDVYAGIHTIIGNIGNVLERISSGSQNTVFEPRINVEINHNGEMSDIDAKRYGEQIANTAIDKLYSAFERRGISGLKSSRLKP